MDEAAATRAELLKAFGGALLLAGLCLLGLPGGFLLFHGIAEVVSIVVAASVYALAWNARRFLDNSYLLFAGLGLVAAAGVDLLHLLAYEGMGFFPGRDANLPTQLWLIARFIETLAMLGAPFVVLGGRRTALAVVGFVSLATVLVASAFLGVFPDAFLPGTGLTPFKRYAEYTLSGLLVLAVGLTWRRRRQFHPRVLGLILGAVSLTALSELSLTFYVSVYGLSNLVGHLLKVMSFYLMYRAVIETGLTRPFDLLFRDLQGSRAALQEANDGLEVRVRQRTEDLTRAMGRLDEERQRLFTVLDNLPGWVVLRDADRNVLYANGNFIARFGDPQGRRCEDLMKELGCPCEDCPADRVSRTGVPAEWEWTGAGRTYEIRGFALPGDLPRLVVELGLDVTEHRQLEREVLEAGEQERRRLGQDLHDDLGQTLTGIQFLAATLAKRLEGEGSWAAPEAAAIAGHAKDAHQQARALSRGLIPVQQGPEGLGAALAGLADRIASTFQVDCRLESPAPVPVADALTANHLFRIAQEAVSNAVRHGQAKTIAIGLTARNGRILLTVDDDGSGMPADAPTDKGSGLRIMGYRARLIGGTLRIEPGPLGGVRVACELAAA